ncbi:ABC transporter permease [uncultured Draconibacterium sp.]|uniref:ABC transporter permease n=1 Tax=uncultured Draconibacterium sp. TaxID=1573823 RepID=UPI0032168FD3
MEQFLTFVKKEFYHIFRDTWTMIILLVLPIVMLILFGFMMTTEVKNTHFAIYDPSHDVATQGIVNKISLSEYFIFDGYLDSPEQIETIFRKGKIGLVVVFGERFYENMMHTGDAQVQLIADGSDPNTASTLTMYATSMIASYQQDITGDISIPYQITPEVKLLYNPTLKGSYNFVPGVMGMILMLICAMMTSVSIAREKELGTMEILLVSPMQSIQIIISKVVPYFFLSVINLTTILLLSVFVLDVPINGSLSLLILISFIFIFVSLALGLLISSAVDKQMVALLISAMVLMMPVMMLSGMMFPLENMPVALQWLSHVIPAKWFMIAVKKIMIQGLGFSSIYKEFAILSIMAVSLIAISIKRFKYRLE